VSLYICFSSSCFLRSSARGRSSSSSRVHARSRLETPDVDELFWSTKRGNEPVPFVIYQPGSYLRRFFSSSKKECNRLSKPRHLQRWRNATLQKYFSRPSLVI
jgi:hypothetical protein